MSDQPRRVSREDLHVIVWQTPMTKLAKEFGISDNGLAKICQRLRVPYPPRGYWAKKAAGKHVVSVKLQAAPDHVPNWVDIIPTKSNTSTAQTASAAVEAAKVLASEITALDDLSALHQRVKAWVIEHKQKQREEEQERKRHPRDSWRWASFRTEDLTERDLYRFRVTSTVFKAIERVGGTVQEFPKSGRGTILIGGQKIECSIKEKMQKSHGGRAEDTKWTAFPHDYNSALRPTGFVRMTIDTYVGGKQREWVETSKQKMDQFIPEIAGSMVWAGEFLDLRERERAEDHRRYEEKRQRELELQREKEIEQQRWSRFREKAANWEEHTRLVAFQTELRKRLQDEGDIEINGRSISQWADWAQEKIDELDPFYQGVTGLFHRILK